MNKFKVIELFAGVGGFKIGLESSKMYEVIWSNQWEPSTNIQYAAEIFKSKFKNSELVCKDIAEIKTSEIPDHDVLTAGFPCQDYSVASTLKRSKGLVGKKGILFWEIERILNEKENKPKYLILENVDRLLKSPASQRGRDFAIMLKALGSLGYALEWRVINAAEYGMPQKRRRIFIIGYLKGSSIYKKLEKQYNKDKIGEWIHMDGVVADKFKIEKMKELFLLPHEISKMFEKNIKHISDNFNSENSLSPFLNSGVYIDNKVFTKKVTPKWGGEYKNLKSVLEKGKVDKEFYINKDDLHKWKYLKGPKKEERITDKGYKYTFAEGGMNFPDDLNEPSRTIITGEGGSGPSRFKHVIKTSSGSYRRLTPVELERLNGFEDNHTLIEGIPNSKRAFMMGNALVVDVVKRLGTSLYNKNK